MRKSNRWRPDFSTGGKNFLASAQIKACDERREEREQGEYEKEEEEEEEEDQEKEKEGESN